MPLFDFADLNEENAEDQFEPYQILTHPDGSFVELGRGSMGITYQAIDSTLQFPVALKVIDFKAGAWSPIENGFFGRRALQLN